MQVFTPHFKKQLKLEEIVAIVALTENLYQNSPLQNNLDHFKEPK